MPPQPSGSPQALPVQSGVQQSQPTPSLRQMAPGSGQPLQTLPQPSAIPQPLFTQFGTHLQTPDLQVRPAGQAPVRHLPPQPLDAPQVWQLGVQGGLGAGGFWPKSTQESTHLPA
jgi:hypothetical protein